MSIGEELEGKDSIFSWEVGEEEAEWGEEEEEEEPDILF